MAKVFISHSSKDKDVILLFKDIILSAYGEKSEDGRSFIKKRNGVRLAEEFEQSPAYDALFTELVLDPDKASVFINGIMPKDLINDVNNANLQAKMSGIPSGNN